MYSEMVDLSFWVVGVEVAVVGSAEADSVAVWAVEVESVKVTAAEVVIDAECAIGLGVASC